ncbi:hypothetical protein ACIRVK_43765 [Streptomyces sp. NPDC101152]|uniref:hypothetical protein n=1 Tax=Streptomyces sp. NPDC101152 TaxID=3366116 RepID=UPI0038254497
MTDTAVELETVEPVESAQLGQPVRVSDEQLVAMLVERARSEGLQLTGQGGLLQQLTKRVLESALEGEHRPPNPRRGERRRRRLHTLPEQPRRAEGPLRTRVTDPAGDPIPRQFRMTNH